MLRSWVQFLLSAPNILTTIPTLMEERLVCCQIGRLSLTVQKYIRLRFAILNIEKSLTLHCTALVSLKVPSISTSLVSAEMGFRSISTDCTQIVNRYTSLTQWQSNELLTRRFLVRVQEGVPIMVRVLAQTVRALLASKGQRFNSFSPTTTSLSSKGSG